MYKKKKKWPNQTFLVKSRNLGKAICTKYFHPDLIKQGRGPCNNGRVCEEYFQSHFAKKPYQTNYPLRTVRFIRIFVILYNPLFKHCSSPMHGVAVRAVTNILSKPQPAGRFIYLLSVVQNSDTDLTHVGAVSSKRFFMWLIYLSELIAWFLPVA